MQTVNIHAAKTRLSPLIDQAAAGDGIVIARAGRPIMLRIVVQHRTTP